MTVKVPAWISLLLLWAVGFATATACTTPAPKACSMPCCAHKGKVACLMATPHRTQTQHMATPPPVGTSSPAPILPPLPRFAPVRLEYAVQSLPPVERTGRSPPLRAPPLHLR